MNLELFADDDDRAPRELAPGAWLLPGFARAAAPALLAGVDAVIAQSGLRRMLTPGGLTMQVAMTNCGALGWVSDRRGYRYQADDPLNGARWPAMPEAFAVLARDAADAASYADFAPDACLVNRYEPGTKLSLHQDRDEADFTQPIVSVSLGLPAVFQFGGLARAERPARVPLSHGDVVVWGGPARLRFHGVLPLAEGSHPLLGRQRINLTFRKAG